MRSIFTTFFLANITLLFSQTTTPFKYLEVNNVKAMVSARGYISNNFATGQASYEIPKGNGTHTLYELSPAWSGNIDGVIVCAFNPNSLSGNMLGPVSNDYGSSWHQNTRMIFSVSEQDAYDHQMNWNQSGYTTPQYVQDWPGNGNPSEGTDLYLAPFEDVDGNLEYTPANGDYPIVKGDDNAFSIYHFDSIYAPAPNSVGVKYPLEVRQMAYQYASNNDINNTTFIKYIVVNRGSDTIEDFKFGFYADFDLGGPSDDYVGTDSMRNLFYVYNADNLDETSNISGYEANPPAFGVKILNNNLHATTVLSDTDPLIHAAYPAALNFLMNGYYTNSTPFQNSNNETVQLIYKGDPNVSGSESEIELSNTAGDRRTLLSISPVDLAPNEYMCYDIALVYGQGTDHLNSVVELQNAADEIQMFYDNGQNNCWTPPAFLSTEEKEEAISEAKIYPNPFENNFTIENTHSIKNVEVININGQTVKTMSPNQKYTQINTTTLSPGMYFVKITDKRNNLRTYRVIKR